MHLAEQKLTHFGKARIRPNQNSAESRMRHLAKEWELTTAAGTMPPILMNDRLQFKHIDEKGVHGVWCFKDLPYAKDIHWTIDYMHTSNNVCHDLLNSVRPNHRKIWIHMWIEYILIIQIYLMEQNHRKCLTSKIATWCICGVKH